MSEDWTGGDAFDENGSSETEDLAAVLADATTPTDALPPDIEAIWGKAGMSSDVARQCIAKWGEDAFRVSALHRVAVDEAGRQARMDVVRKEFIKERK